MGNKWEYRGTLQQLFMNIKKAYVSVETEVI